MAMSRERPISNVFFDTSFYVAINNPSDSLHNKAKKVLQHLGTIDHSSFSSNFVFLEAVTVISQKIGRNVAINFYEKAIQSVREIKINADLEKQTWEVFKSIENKDISYVDCSILAVIEEFKIDTLATFDKHFDAFQKDFLFQILDFEE